MSTATSPRAHQSPAPAPRRPARPVPPRIREDAAPSRTPGQVAHRRWRRILEVTASWTATTTALGFLAIAFMVNTDAYAAGVPARLALTIIASTALAGIIGATITLIVRRQQC